MPLHNVSTNKLEATFNHSHKRCSECCVTMYTSYRGSVPCTFHRGKPRRLVYSLDHKKKQAHINLENPYMHISKILEDNTESGTYFHCGPPEVRWLGNIQQVEHHMTGR
jgi:hypothetical protein